MLPEIPSLNKLYPGRRKVFCDAFSGNLSGYSFEFSFLQMNENFTISIAKSKKGF